MKVEEAKKMISYNSRIETFINAREDEVFTTIELSKVLKMNRGKLIASLDNLCLAKRVFRYRTGLRRFYGCQKAIKKFKEEIEEKGVKEG